MVAFFYLQLLPLSILFILSQSGYAEVQDIRQRRQSSNRADSASINQQESSARTSGYYNSPLFKAPNLNGEKPLGWFDTKYPNWIMNRGNSPEQNERVEGKNGAPSSLQANPMPQSREDGGVSFLQKVAKQYVGKGEKSFNFGQYGGHPNRGSICTNFDTINGFVFGKFPCPLPLNTGMNQMDRFCCGAPNSQFCCNEQEYNYYQRLGQSHVRDPKSGLYRPSPNYIVAIVVPICSTIAVVAALVIIFLYYRRITAGQNTTGKPSPLIRAKDRYSAVPQNAHDRGTELETRSSRTSITHS